MENSYGLIGRNISYSFSKRYFSEKFEKEDISAEYLNFDLPEISSFPDLLQDRPQLKGVNVTIPYKEEIIPFLDELHPVAERIGAVNTIKIEENKITGYNTDYFGFKESLVPLLEKQHKKALILGTGGASKAVIYTLNSLGIEFKMVSRNPSEGQFSYNQLNEKIISEFFLIINCTPLGTYPETNFAPQIPYKFLSKKHLLYDLVYNPPQSLFLQKGEEMGAKTCNGQKMLILQAEKAWEIWQG